MTEDTVPTINCNMVNKLKFRFELKMKNKIRYSLFLFIIGVSQIAAQNIGGFGNTSDNGMDLTALSLISVTIGGDFVVEGTFPASNTERVDQFVTRIASEYRNGAIRFAKDEESLMRINSELEAYSKRNILLKRFDGTELKVDLQKFRITGNYKFNPFLKNGDVIIFPPLDLERNFIDITGAVNKPIKFPYSEGDKLSDAIQLAQGLNSAYSQINEAEISRLSTDGENENVKIVKIKDNPFLQRGDRIRILSDNNNKKDYSVLVLGEVKQPGKIHITKSNTSLAEVIKKAGGFTNNASLARSELIRDSKSVSQLILENPIYNKSNINKFTAKLADRLKQSKMTELLLMQRMSDVVLEDTVFFSLDNKLKELQTQAVVDFTKIFSDSTQDGNFKLRDGDVIYIPTKEKYVYVYGQVNSPGLVSYIEGKDYNYYLEQAGGLGEDYENDIKLIKGKTKSWHSVNDTMKIERGDYIYVPKNPPRSWGYYLRNVSFISAIVSTIATIVLVINQSKNQYN